MEKQDYTREWAEWFVNNILEYIATLDMKAAQDMERAIQILISPPPENDYALDKCGWWEKMPQVPGIRK